jgi:S1-C subfamily serine protease
VDEFSLRPSESLPRPVNRLFKRCLTGTAFLFFSIIAPAFADSSSQANSANKTAIPQVPIGLSNLIIRIEGDDEIGLAGPDYRVRLIEHMRELGFNAVGAESLVFDRDESHRAEFLLGGIVRELDCQDRYSGIRCRVGVEWQLLNVATDTIVYKVTARSAVYDVPKDKSKQIGGMLLSKALDSVLQREQLRGLLASPKPTRKKDATFPSATYATCAPLAKAMPTAATDVLKATVVVKSGTGFGSGFFLTTDGLTLTAAHVVDSDNLTLKLHDGSEVDAVVVRLAHRADVALLRPKQPLAQQACLATSTKVRADVGSELYAIGTPASLDLAFTLTRGIVSSVRVIEGQPILQTDAPVSRGNSGGPMVDTSGAVVGIASSKLVGGSVEGIAFAVPIVSALSALGLTAGSSTDAALASGSWTPPTSGQQRNEALEDSPDAVPSLDPEGDRYRAQQAEQRARRQELALRLREQNQAERERAAEESRILSEREALRDKATPAYVKVMYWGGMGVGIAGGAAALWSYNAYDDKSTRPEYEKLALYNTIGWAAFGVGAGAFTASFILRPPLPDLPPDADTQSSSQLVVGPGSVRWEGSF